MSDFNYISTVLSISKSGIEISEEQYSKVISIFTEKDKRIAELEEALINHYHYGTLQRSDIEQLIPKVKEQDDD